MNIELVEKLKNAGFRQVGGGFYVADEFKLYIPTLSELIEACGDEVILRKVKYSDSGETTYYAGTDIEACDRGDCGGYINNMVEGFTAEEAMGNLWLKLQEL